MIVLIVWVVFIEDDVEFVRGDEKKAWRIHCS